MEQLSTVTDSFRLRMLTSFRQTLMCWRTECCSGFWLRVATWEGHWSQHVMVVPTEWYIMSCDEMFCVFQWLHELSEIKGFFSRDDFDLGIYLALWGQEVLPLPVPRLLHLLDSARVSHLLMSIGSYYSSVFWRLSLREMPRTNVVCHTSWCQGDQ